MVLDQGLLRLCDRLLDRVELLGDVHFHVLRDKNGSKLPAAELAVAMAEFRREISGDRWSWTIQKLDESLTDWDKFVAEKADDEALRQFR